MSIEKKIGDEKGPYTVPEGYFDGLAASILDKVRNSGPLSVRDELKNLSPLLAGLSREMPYSLPDGYFSSTLEALPDLMWDEHASSLLDEVSKITPYTVPSGYFEAFPEKMLSAVPRREARVVPILSRKWMRMASAAIIGGIICMSGYTYFLDQGNHPNNGSAVVASLQSLPTTTLNDFLKNLGIDATNNNQTAVNNPSQGNSDVKQMLQGVPENEIDSFLKQVPSEGEELAIN